MATMKEQIKELKRLNSRLLSDVRSAESNSDKCQERLKDALKENSELKELAYHYLNIIKGFSEK